MPPSWPLVQRSVLLILLAHVLAVYASPSQNILPRPGSDANFNAHSYPHSNHFTTPFYEFSNEIKKVAVIGGGPNGLLYTSTLLEHGFEVRIFEKAPRPGGNWLYTSKKPLHAAFPNRPNENAAYFPDIPSSLPLTRIYNDGDDGLTNDWRLREHWIPSSIWKNMKSSVPAYMMALPNIEMPPDTPWRFNQNLMQRYVRQYASSLGLNSNDEEHTNVTSYSTRVERVHKNQRTHKWILTLRKMEVVPYSGGKLRADWWQEEFDAVVVGTNSESDSPWVPSPNIPGLAEWANAYPDEIVHVREYRTADELTGKKVLVVGGSLSATGVSTDLANFGVSVTVSVTPITPDDPALKEGIRRMFPKNATFIPIIESFPKLLKEGVKEARIRLVNGTTVSGFDHIIFATGYRKSFPFLADYHNSTITGYDEPETRIPPILTDGTHLRSLHWTGHYIPDPTLLVSNAHPYYLGVYQALGAAKTWSKKARLPSTSEMWKQYPGAGKDIHQLLVLGELTNRLYVTWLNNESLEFGGRFVEPLPIRDRQGFECYAAAEWVPGIVSAEYLDSLDQMPRSEWAARNGKQSKPYRDDYGRSILGYGGDPEPRHKDDWMEFRNSW